MTPIAKVIVRQNMPKFLSPLTIQIVMGEGVGGGVGQSQPKAAMKDKTKMLMVPYKSSDFLRKMYQRKHNMILW